MKHVYRLLNPVKNYDWGSRTAIAELLGRQSPTLQPQAELWIGAHPLGCSIAVTEMGEVPLDRLLKQEASALLGRKASRVFRKRLPFLFKVLAAERPLSLQVHPTEEQARAGFEREEAAGLAREAPERQYSDPFAKPEILCALTPFWMLRGFRPAAEVRADLETLPLPALQEHLPASLASLRAEGETSVAGLFLALVRTRGEERERLAREIAAAAGERVDDLRVGRAARWTERLAQLHPGDPSILAPFLLHLVELQPGEAVFTGAGVVHSYLQGTGVELMGASDNVTRAGLTTKHVDADELGELVDLSATPVEVLRPQPSSLGFPVFETPCLEFRLGRCDVGEDGYESSDERGLELLLSVGGEVQFENADRELTLRSGQSLLVGAGAAPYRLRGEGTLYVAMIGDLSQVKLDELPWEIAGTGHGAVSEEDRHDAAEEGEPESGSESEGAEPATPSEIEAPQSS